MTKKFRLRREYQLNQLKMIMSTNMVMNTGVRL